MSEQKQRGGPGRGQGRKPLAKSGEVMKPRAVRMTARVIARREIGNTSGKKAGTHWLVFMKPNQIFTDTHQKENHHDNCK